VGGGLIVGDDYLILPGFLPNWRLDVEFVVLVENTICSVRHRQLVRSPVKLCPNVLAVTSPNRRPLDSNPMSCHYVMMYLVSR
jgi:hypothetical protein